MQNLSVKRVQPIVVITIVTRLTVTKLQDIAIIRSRDSPPLLIKSNVPTTDILISRLKISGKKPSLETSSFVTEKRRFLDIYNCR